MTKTFRNIFLFTFILSALTCGLSFMASLTNFNPAPASGSSPPTQPAPTPSPGHENDIEPGIPFSTSIAVISSLATSLISLVGLVTTTVITWRKEKRESALADVERRKLELELEKSKLELEELKKGKKK